MSEESAPPAPAAPEAEPGAGGAPSRFDRLLVAAFGVYVVLVFVAAWAQLTDNRAVLKWFDLNEWFQR